MNVLDIVTKINESIIDYRNVLDDIKINTGKLRNNMEIVHDNFKIHDKVVSFYNGREWNVISFDFMRRHPIFYYKHWSDKEMTYLDNSLLVCPITLRSMIYKGKIKVKDIERDYELVLINLDTDDTFTISNPYTGHVDSKGIPKKIKSHVKRYEVKILEHRDIFAFDSDPRYITIEDDRHTPIMDLDYYANRLGVYGEILPNALHPKTLVYVVQYYSQNDKKYKHVILIGPNAQEDEVTGYKYRSSHIWKYMRENREMIIKKKAFIYPILWYTIEKIEMSNYVTDVLS